MKPEVIASHRALFTVLIGLVALVGIATGTGALLFGAFLWRFLSRGPFSDGVIHTDHAEIPFVWSGETTWKDYAVFATLAVLAIVLVLASYRFGFRRHAESGSREDCPPGPHTT